MKLKAGIVIGVAALSLVAVTGCGGNDKAEEFEDVTLEKVDDPVRSAFEGGLRQSAESDGDLSDAEITCVISGTRDEIDDEELKAAATAQIEDPGSDISDDLRADVETIADDCGVELEE